MPKWSRPTSATRWSTWREGGMKNDIEALLDRRLAHLKIEALSAGYGPFLVLRDLML